MKKSTRSPRTDVLDSGKSAGSILVGSYLDLSQQFRQISGGTPCPTVIDFSRDEMWPLGCGQPIQRP